MLSGLKGGRESGCRFIKYRGVALPESLLESLCHFESPQ